MSTDKVSMVLDVDATPVAKAKGSVGELEKQIEQLGAALKKMSGGINDAFSAIGQGASSAAGRAGGGGGAAAGGGRSGAGQAHDVVSRRDASDMRSDIQIEAQNRIMQLRRQEAIRQEMGRLDPKMGPAAGPGLFEQLVPGAARFINPATASAAALGAAAHYGGEYFRHVDSSMNLEFQNYSGTGRGFAWKQAEGLPIVGGIAHGVKMASTDYLGTRMAQQHTEISNRNMAVELQMQSAVHGGELHNQALYSEMVSRRAGVVGAKAFSFDMAAADPGSVITPRDILGVRSSGEGAAKIALMQAQGSAAGLRGKGDSLERFSNWRWIAEGEEAKSAKALDAQRAAIEGIERNSTKYSVSKWGGIGVSMLRGDGGGVAKGLLMSDGSPESHINLANLDRQAAIARQRANQARSLESVELDNQRKNKEALAAADNLVNLRQAEYDWEKVGAPARAAEMAGRQGAVAYGMMRPDQRVGLGMAVDRFAAARESGNVSGLDPFSKQMIASDPRFGPMLAENLMSEEKNDPERRRQFAKLGINMFQDDEAKANEQQDKLNQARAKAGEQLAETLSSLFTGFADKSGEQEGALVAAAVEEHFDAFKRGFFERMRQAQLEAPR